MPINQPKTLGQLYEQCGHIYVTNQGYVHMHFYTSDETVVKYITGMLPARFRQHQAIYDVVIAKRASLALACRKLLRYALSENRRRELELALSFAVAIDRAARNGHMLALREILPKKGEQSAPPLSPTSLADLLSEG